MCNHAHSDHVKFVSLRSCTENLSESHFVQKRHNLGDLFNTLRDHLRPAERHTTVRESRPWPRNLDHRHPKEFARLSIRKKRQCSTCFRKKNTNINWGAHSDYTVNNLRASNPTKTSLLCFLGACDDGKESHMNLPTSQNEALKTNEHADTSGRRPTVFPAFISKT